MSTETLLHPDHLHDLRISGLNDQTIELMGARSMVPSDVPGFEHGLYAKVKSVLALPYPNVGTFSRYKLFPPIETQSGTMKYYQPLDSGNHIYMLPPVAQIINDVSVPLWFVEGEKKAATGVQHGFNAIGFSGIWNWKEKGNWEGIEELKQIPFADRSITIVPDSDTWLRDDLQRAIYAFARYLDSRGAKVQVVVLPQPTTNKVGLDDYLLSHSKDELEREKSLSIKHSTLKQHREWYEQWKTTKLDMSKETNFVAEDKPYEDVVYASQLLDLLVSFLSRYVAVPLTTSHAVALWILHAWVLDAFDISPYLFLTSATKRCGKTTLLDLIRSATPRAVAVSNITGAAIFRVIEKYKPTLIIDEADSFLGEKEELRGILNAGHRRSSAFVARTVGDQHEVKLFSVWSPKAVAAIGKIAETLEDRSIIIQMRRRAPGEKVERFRAAEVNAVGSRLRSMAARWASDYADRLRQREPVMPDSLNDRARDNWEPLFAIAELAGGVWPERAKSASLVLSGQNTESENSALVDLLREFHRVFLTRDRIFSRDLVKELTDDPDGRWVEWRQGKPITQRQVARLLSSLNIGPRKIRIGNEALNGYLAEWFQDSFRRYLPEEPACDPEHPEQHNDFAHLSEKNHPAQSAAVTDQKSHLTIGIIDDVPDVPDQKTALGQLESSGEAITTPYDVGTGQPVTFIDGNGKLTHAASFDQAWAVIKAGRDA